MYISLRSYLESLKAIESAKPEGKRKHVPSVSELAKGVGMHDVSLSRIANNKVSQLALDTGDKIITEMRRRGFQMQVQDLLTYLPPEE